MRNLIIKCFILFSFTLHSQHDLKQEIKEIELQINTTESQISAVGKRKEIAEKKLDSLKKNLEIESQKIKRPIDSLIELSKPYKSIINNLNTKINNTVLRINRYRPLTKGNISKFKFLLDKEIYLSQKDQQDKFVKWEQRLITKYNITSDIIYIDSLILIGDKNNYYTISPTKKENKKIQWFKKKGFLIKPYSDAHSKEKLLRSITGIDSYYFEALEEKKVLEDSIAKTELMLMPIKQDIKNFEQIKAQISNTYASKIKTSSDLLSSLNNQYSKLTGKQSNLTRMKVDSENKLQLLLKHKAKVAQNKRKYPSKKIENIEVVIKPLQNNELNDGTKLKEARSKGEWDRFIQSETPAFKRFTGDLSTNKLSKGYIYNYYALKLDNLIPEGFHPLNIVEAKHLIGRRKTEFQQTTAPDIVIYSGKLKYNPFANISNDYCYVLSTNRYKKGILDIKEASYHEPSIKEEEYQLLICPNKTAINHLNTNVVIGNIEFMKSFLKVKTFRNGDRIKHITDMVEWELAIEKGIPAYCNFNNQDDGTGFIYNIHAWNDRRGLLPKGWRSMDKWDLINLEGTLGYNFNLQLSEAPYNNPKGYRDVNGVFEKTSYELDYGGQESNENYFYHLNFSFGNNRSMEGLDVYSEEFNSYDLKYRLINNSGYVLCVRDYIKVKPIHKVSSNLSPKKTINYGASEYLIEDNIDFSDDSNKKNYWDYDDLYQLKKLRQFEKSLISDYFFLYNQTGIDILNELYNTDYAKLFEGKSKLKLIGANVDLNCNYTQGHIYKGGSYDHISGLVITRNVSDSDVSFECVYNEVATSRYSDHNQTISGKLKKISETKYALVNDKKDIELQLCFDGLDCHPDGSPIENFYIRCEDNIFKLEGWEENIEGAWWNWEEIEALNSVKEFLEKYDSDQSTRHNKTNQIEEIGSTVNFSFCDLNNFQHNCKSSGNNAGAYLTVLDKEDDCMLKFEHYRGHDPIQFFPKNKKFGFGRYDITAKANNYISDNVLHLFREDDNAGGLSFFFKPKNGDNPGIEIEGKNIDIKAKNSSFRTNEWYNISIFVSPNKIKVSIDDKIIIDENKFLNFNPGYFYIDGRNVTEYKNLKFSPLSNLNKQDDVVVFAEKEAEYPGGAAAMMKWINDNLDYPQTSIEMNEQGRVFLSFVVEKDGTISNVAIDKGVSPDIDKEAKRVIRIMPKWRPGEVNGEKVRARCWTAINFQLN